MSKQIENSNAELIAEAREAERLAFAELLRILRSGERVRMSIPADVSRDTDLIISAALKKLTDLADALESAGETQKPEPTELDPLPWVAPGGNSADMHWDEQGDPRLRRRWKPRPEFIQDRAAYPSTETGSEN